MAALENGSGSAADVARGHHQGGGASSFADSSFRRRAFAAGFGSGSSVSPLNPRRSSRSGRPCALVIALGGRPRGRLPRCLRARCAGRSGGAARLLPSRVRGNSRAVFHASATVLAPAAVPIAPFALQRPSARISRMNEKAAPRGEDEPRHAGPTRKDPTVENSRPPELSEQLTDEPCGAMSTNAASTPATPTWMSAAAVTTMRTSPCEAGRCHQR